VGYRPRPPCRTGRISRCSLEAAPIAEAAAWINRYSKYWDAQFKVLTQHLLAIEHRRSAKKSHRR
jgi:hypothetical protein